MKEVHDDEDKDYQDDQLEEAARLLHEANMIVASLYNKNIQVMEAVCKKVNKDEDDSVKDQFLTEAQIKMRSASNYVEGWIIGGMGEREYPLLDASIHGVNPDHDQDKANLGMLPHINQKYHNLLIEFGFHRLYFRFGGGIKGLAKLNTEILADLASELAGIVEAYMGLFCRQ